MTAQDKTPGDDQLKLKLTIAVDENPDLYHALRHIRDPRRRTRRLKDLAVKGLMLERAPASILGLAAAQTPDGYSARTVIGQSVSSMLEWEDSTAS